MSHPVNDEFLDACVDELMRLYSYQYSTSHCFGELIDELIKDPDMTIRDFFEQYAPEPEEEED